MRNVIGQVATGDDFYDRVEEQKQFWNSLDSDNLLLLAPRRVGKTSLMRRMCETATDHKFRPAFIDVSDCGNQGALVERLYRTILQSAHGDGLWQRIADGPLGKALHRVKSAGVGGFRLEFQENAVTDWVGMGEQLADALSNLDERWLIQIDELPVFVLRLLDSAGRDSVHEFLYWMRRLRLDYPAVRWLLAGSIGLDTVAARLNIADAINDLRIVTLGAFSETTADGLLRELAASYKVKLPKAVRRHIITRCGWPIPYYLHLIFGHIRPCPAPSPGNVDRAIDELLGPNHKGYFDYWRQRLSRELGQPDATYAIALLNAASCGPEGATRETLSQVLAAHVEEAGAREEKLGYLLDVFYSDGYLVESENRWRFRFPLLREFWARRVARVR